MTRSQKGFTLIELSIVLVVIGLIVGGVLVGREMIRAAELRSVMSDITQFETSINTFKIKYNCLPGDCSTATDFFSTSGNGDNDGLVEMNNSYEAYRFWQHLALAGMIPGEYSGVSGSGGCGNKCASLTGTNVPASKITNGGYMALSELNNNPTYYYNDRYSNLFLFGVAPTSWYNYGPILTGAEVKGIDEKMDDGLLISGKVSSWKSSSQPNCTSSTSDTTAQYVVNNSLISCNLVYWLK